MQTLNAYYDMAGQRAVQQYRLLPATRLLGLNAWR